ncbi:hypothetical protein FOL46_006031 [Perkinsus olseni]|uniref:Uncharacterized protein n=1 Tax=Perkinsus olseni TaxID=32597 RepID=A0A7J6MR01_PEROL|nr:hypothetical protein FOL46_006031 [Perkinsus olseni]
MSTASAQVGAFGFLRSRGDILEGDSAGIGQDRQELIFSRSSAVMSWSRGVPSDYPYSFFSATDRVAPLRRGGRPPPELPLPDANTRELQERVRW